MFSQPMLKQNGDVYCSRRAYYTFTITRQFYAKAIKTFSYKFGDMRYQKASWLSFFKEKEEAKIFR